MKMKSGTTQQLNTPTFHHYRFNTHLKNFAWADQRPRVYFIFHNAQLGCEECFIE